MDTLNARPVIYAALVILSAIAGLFAGITAAIWTLVQVALVIELVYWLGRGRDASAFTARRLA